MTTPRLVFANKRENVNRTERKNNKKNKLSAPLWVGSTKRITTVQKNQRNTVIRRAGRYPFVLFLSSLRFFRNSDRFGKIDLSVMDVLLIISAIVLGFAALFYFLNKKLKPSDEMLKVFSMLQDSAQKDRQVLMESLQRNSRDLNERLDNAAKVIGDVQKNVGEMSEIGRGMRDLQEFLQSPKIRGNIGEQVLKDLISQMFPKSSFYLQHTFKSGEKVDAAIKTTAGILPIDSKFPMENFQKMNKSRDKKEQAEFKKLFVRDIKKHITDISRKYILPDEGTMDFALMYIPSEAVYYEVVNTDELVGVAQSARVYPVSPSTLYAHLQTILLSFEGQKVESHAKEIFKTLRGLQKDYSKVEENMTVLQKHIGNANNMMNTVFSGFSLMGQKITSIHRLEEKSETME